VRVGTGTFQMVIDALSWQALVCIGIALIILAGTLWKMRGLRADVPAAWGFAALCVMGSVAGKWMAPKFQNVLEAAQTAPAMLARVVMALGYSTKLPIVSAAVPFALLAAAVGVVLLAHTDATENTRRRLTIVLVAATAIFALVLILGFGAMWMQVSALRKLGAR